MRSVAIARKKKNLPARVSSITRSGHLKISGCIYQLRAGNISLPIFQRLRTLYYINRYGQKCFSPFHVSVLQLCTCQIFKILVVDQKNTRLTKAISVTTLLSLVCARNKLTNVFALGSIPSDRCVQLILSY
ncbi:hypothetical protein C0J52_28224 [Blattella germanica]|nr:hypothetical protein C0J52_28224 [Blattella germanica]